HQQSDRELRRSRYHHDFQHDDYLSRNPVHGCSRRQGYHAGPAAVKTLPVNMRQARWKRGATMVEFAMSALVCFGLLFAVMEMASGGYSYSLVGTGARGSVR